MFCRFSALPPGLNQCVFSRLSQPSIRHATTWTRHARLNPQFFSRVPPPTPRLGRQALWAIPVAGGIYFYLKTPKPEPHIPTIFTSPTLIPCKQQVIETTILAPDEEDRSILSRIGSLFVERIWEPVLTAGRFIHLLILFLPVLFTSPMLLIGRPERRLGGDRWGAVWWYGFLTAQMQRAGPTFVKLAQWAASRADLFPALLCDRLGALHSSGKPHTLRHTKRVIERVFQRPFHEVFEEFDEKPIGCGAIAQVYRATLKRDLIPPSHLEPRRHHKRSLTPTILQQPAPSAPSAAVAVKILHPRVDKLISRDLSIMSFFAKALSLFPGMQWLSLPEEVDIFGKMMSEQLDLRIEANNLVEFESKFQGRKLPVSFPRPLEMWSTRDVLIEEYENALPLEVFMKNGGGPYNNVLAEVGLDAFLNMLLLDNFVHSDLHPGNIMIKFCKPVSTWTLLSNIWTRLKENYWPWHRSSSAAIETVIHEDKESDTIVEHLRALKHDPQAWSTALRQVRDEGYLPEIVFIDAGLVTTLDATDRRNFLDLFRAVAEFDGYRAGQLMVERCRTPELAIDTETFALKMQHIVLNVKRKTFSLGQIKISDILNDVLKAVRQHHVKMEADFVNTVISILLLEGIGRQLDPNLDLFKSALPILRQLGRQMSTQDTISQIPPGNLFAFLKVWFWSEARGIAAAALVDVDELVRDDWLTPAI
ncbi:ABC1-domain-containing protein [Panus rudis PR-1116 ss-1]|nr:ABC1-domain-containing protein [Panus rudis PR-1116 ss-1]